MYIVSFKLYKNEYNYITKTKELNLFFYLLKRFICGKYCLFIPVMDPTSDFYKRDVKLGWYYFLIFILLFIIVPIFVMYINKIFEKTKKKKR